MFIFGENKTRDKQLSKYILVPFLEESGILLLAISSLWHIWSINRSKELKTRAHDLKNTADYNRKVGLAWASDLVNLNRSHLILSQYAHHRYYKESSRLNHPEAAHYLISATAQLLFLILPIFQKIDKLYYEEKGLESFYEKIEFIMEFPCAKPFPKIPENSFNALINHAILLECEGLAYTQAKMEDSFIARNPKFKRTKKSKLSDAELRKLADDIDVSFETIKDVFETEHSSWWNKYREFNEQAKTEKEIFLSSLPIEESIKEAINIAWNPGSTHQTIQPDCYYQEECADSELTLNACISIFLSLRNRHQTKLESAAFNRPALKALKH